MEIVIEVVTEVKMMSLKEICFIYLIDFYVIGPSCQHNWIVGTEFCIYKWSNLLNG